ncbi:DUF5009 domain-containing protein [Bacteroides thetaiotaomicron]|uniref:DUF5009 domain-containing protein n=1 Tax=Bacteroides thetaiotaomicron TaxID=818 RepID=UPI0021665E90|nr:DUF5009 domain-containing protein [Bacteroides thetaiotaomicron]MCS2785896.1 DUF5009 domain-containing protein [Bacteroides thetaiotaomicron]
MKRGVQLTFFFCHLHSAFLSVCVEFSRRHQEPGCWLFFASVLFPDVHAHSFENAGLGTYRHKDSRIRNCGNHDAYYFTCRWKNVQSVFYSNVIILLVANMAIFGSALYIFTMHNRWLRLGVLLLLMAVILGSTVESSWTQVVFNYTPFAPGCIGLII